MMFVAIITLGHLGMGREGKLCFLKVPVIEGYTQGARFQEEHVLIDECMWGAGFQEDRGPSQYLDIWNLLWDPSSNAEFGGQPV